MQGEHQLPEHLTSAQPKSITREVLFKRLNEKQVPKWENQTSTPKFPRFATQVVLGAHGHPALWVTQIEVFSCSVIRLHEGAVCSVSRKLNIERQGIGQVKQTPVKIFYFIDEFMEIKTQLQ